MNEIVVNVQVTGYQAEVIRLMAEKAGKTVSDYVASFFSDEVHCT